MTMVLGVAMILVGVAVGFPSRDRYPDHPGGDTAVMVLTKTGRPPSPSHKDKGPALARRTTLRAPSSTAGLSMTSRSDISLTQAEQEAPTDTASHFPGRRPSSARRCITGQPGRSSQSSG